MAGEMENAELANGYGRPRTPSMNTFSLTEYQTNPSPPSSSPRSKMKGLVPKEFMLPNGYPDVYNSLLILDSVLTFKIVPAPYPYKSRLRSC